MHTWIEKQRYLIDLTLSSFLRRKVKHVGPLILYALMVFILASVTFFAYTITKEASAKEFLEDHKETRILRFADATAEVIDALDAAQQPRGRKR
ncbi:MAG: hypothetical protein F9K13_11170 [Candidatus Methylomirabilis oxygeniifera]|uniref:Uncharacterized protein n=1 Tax=Methylomirabilis oxygeniifera TaxID=671143 RepID=D5MGT8_METO1|nr:MAG: hypothetical protein F9K13_11170 [Candidatus Methylomirabilis oxyfera]CBE68969.1 protein of unknown function [Candidatus Methylomirabilis oxyfera]